MSVKSKFKKDAFKPYLGDSIHKDILRFKSMLKRGDMTKISIKYGLHKTSVYRFFDAPDVLSSFMLGQIYIAVEDFLGEKK